MFRVTEKELQVIRKAMRKVNGQASRSLSDYCRETVLAAYPNTGPDKGNKAGGRGSGAYSPSDILPLGIMKFTLPRK
jgi:hypothetical protein